MKNVAKVKKLVIYAGILIVNAAPAWASAADSADNSDLLIWIFLGFCALIVVAQLIPAAMVLLGLAKGVKKKKVETVPAEIKV